MKSKPIYESGDVEFGVDNQNGEELTYLPHQCDKWIIGGEEEIKALIKDLQKILLEKYLG